MMEPTLGVQEWWAPSSSHVGSIWAPSSSQATKSRPILKTSKQKIETLEKRKNVPWKVIVDLKIPYTNV